MKSANFKQRSFSLSKMIQSIALVTLAVGLLLATNKQTLAQEESWSTPVMLSTNTLSSWFSDVTVDPWGQPYVVWNSGRPTADRGQMDLLLYSTLGDQGWLEPNDIEVTAYGGYTVRPTIATDRNGALHVSFRGETRIYYTAAPASQAWNTTAWTPRRQISGAGAGAAYYSDIAVDERGGIHIVWGETMSAGMDSKGVWFGTPQGGALYDSRGWPTQDQAGLRGRQVYAILEDSAGVQWFGADDGVYRFDGNAWQRIGLVGQKVNCVTLDVGGELWFGTDRGVTRYDQEEQGDRQWQTYTTNDGLPDNVVHALAADLQGKVWVGTDKGLASYDGQNWMSYFLQEGQPAAISSIAIDNVRENVWVGTNQGLSYYDGQGWRTYTVESGLLSNAITAIAIEREDVIWYGTDRGVGRFNGQEWTSYTPGEGLVGGAVTALLVDKEGTIWVGAEQGASRYDGQTWETFALPAEFAGQKVTALAPDRRANAMCPLCEDVFYRHSTDGGKNWSVPINLSHSFAGSGKPQVRVGQAGHVYVTWEEGEGFLPGGGYPVASMFAHSADGGLTWNKPVVFSSPRGAPQQITLGVRKEGNLIVVWRLPEENLFYYQTSTDHGASWSRPETIPGVIAKPWKTFSLDAYHAATDGADHVHLLVLGYLYSIQEDLALFHLVWNGAAWSPPNRIYASKDPPEWPRIDVGAGNRVYATWFTRDEKHIHDSDQGRYKVWVSSYQADAPAQTPAPTWTPTPPASSDLEPTAFLPTATPTPILAPDTSGLPPGLYTESDEVGQLLLALSPIAIVVLAVVALRSGLFRRRR